MSDNHDPRVVRLAEEYMAWFRRWERCFRGWPRTWDQIEGTASSVVANLGEAFDSETMAQRRKYFGYARASAGEGLRLVRAAGRTGLIPPDAVREAETILNGIRWDVTRLIAWTRRRC